MKTCQTCKKEKELKEYSKGRRNEDGLQKSCKACNKAVNAKFRAKRPQYQKKYYNTPKGKKNKVDALQRMWSKEGGGIYRVINRVTGTIYIGSTTQYVRRRMEWTTYLNNPEDHRRYFSDRMYEDALKYGKDAFEWEKVEPMTGSKQDITDREYQIIKLLYKLGVDIYNVHGVEDKTAM